jgi:hypothetical protein
MIHGNVVSIDEEWLSATVKDGPTIFNFTGGRYAPVELQVELA